MGKPLKRLLYFFSDRTRLKPGVNDMPEFIAHLQVVCHRFSISAGVASNSFTA
jgi:hypothetical protein